MFNTNISVSHEAGKKIAITEEFSNRGRFSMTAPFNLKDSFNNEMDLIDIINTLSKPARNFFTKIKQSCSYKTNIGEIDLSTHDKATRSKIVKELKSFNLIKKVISSKVKFNGLSIKTTNNMYMINPTYIIPSDKYYEDIKNNWDSLP